MTLHKYKTCNLGAKQILIKRENVQSEMSKTLNINNVGLL